MVYLKCMLAGSAASAATLAVLYGVGSLFAMGLKHKYQASQPLGDTILIEWHIHFWPVLCIALLVFAFGFYWEFQRVSIQPSLR